MFARPVPTWPQVLAVLLAGCASEAPRTIQIICQETPTYSTRWGSESAVPVVLGNTFQVTAVPLSSRLLITGARGDTDTSRFLDEGCVAPFPLQGQARWTQEPIPSPSPGKGWEMGEPLETLAVSESWVPTGQTAVLAQGAIVGFVPTTALGDKAPPLERYSEVIREQLVRGAFDEALALTQRATKSFPQEARFHRLLGHLVTLQGGTAPRPPKNLPRLAALPDVLPENPLQPDEEIGYDGSTTVYTRAVGLRIRETAEPTGNVLATLPLNQWLELSSLEEEWAQVNYYPGRQMLFSSYGEFLEFVDEPQVSGWVARRFLSRNSLDAKTALVQAEAALRGGRPAEAIVLFHRAIDAQPKLELNAAHPAYVGLLRASFDNGRFEDLFQVVSAARKPAIVEAPPSRPDHPIVLMGCHGDLAKADIIDLRNGDLWSGLGAAAPFMKQPHACVGGIDPREPREPQEFCPDGECPKPQALRLALDEYKTDVKPEYERWTGKVEARFDSSPYLYFSPKMVGDLEPGYDLVFYTLPLQGGSTDPDTFSATLDKARARAVTLQFPEVFQWNNLPVWIELPTYLDAEFGLAIAGSRDQVMEWLLQRENSFDYHTFRIAEGRVPGEPPPRPPFSVVRLISLTSEPYEHWWRLNPP
ncbi:MAG: tetratricopeptide repeat protein [Cystobacter sp.]